MIYESKKKPSSDLQKEEKKNQSVLYRKRSEDQRGIHPLRAIRVKQGMTLEELAKKIEVSVSYLSRIERKNRKLNINIIQKLSKGLNCHPLLLLRNNLSSNIVDGSTMALLNGNDDKSSSKFAFDLCDLPVYPSTLNATGFLKIQTDNIVNLIVRPKNLSEHNDAYGILLKCDIAQPRYQSGEILFIRPEKHIKTEQCVLLTLQTRLSIIGILHSDYYKQPSEGNQHGDTALPPQNTNTILIKPYMNKYDLSYFDKNKIYQKDGLLAIDHSLIESVGKIVGSIEYEE